MISQPYQLSTNFFGNFSIEFCDRVFHVFKIFAARFLHVFQIFISNYQQKKTGHKQQYKYVHHLESEFRNQITMVFPPGTMTGMPSTESHTSIADGFDIRE